MAAQPALETIGLRRSLRLAGDTVEILRGIDLRIEPTEFVALMGPSGSGKSTLLGILAGLDRPSAGKILVDGVDISSMPESRLAGFRNAKIGMVFQAFNLIPTLTAIENVEIPLAAGNRPDARGRALEMLVAVGLDHRARHRPSQLSGGEQQRVAIARALATRPAIVIADEPTGNLDSATGAVILDLMADLRERTGTTFLIATHDPHVAARAHRIIEIVDGLIARDAPVEIPPPAVVPAPVSP